MLTEKWKDIITVLSIIKKDCVDMKKIKNMLDYDVDVNSQVLDNLYVLGIITLDEYKLRMEVCIDRIKNEVKYAEEQLAEANEKGDEYDPMIFYSLSRMFYGAGIEYKLTTDWNEI